MSSRDPEALQFRRKLRREQTDAEERLWRLLRSRHFGAKFRRQHSVGPYVLDFFCAERRLAIELDGGQHFGTSGLRRDASRTRYLRSQGIRVIRFTNLELLGETDAVVEAVWTALHRDPLTLPLSPR